MVININEEVEDATIAVNVLEEVIRQLNNGNTSGVDPSWELTN